MVTLSVGHWSRRPASAEPVPSSSTAGRGQHERACWLVQVRASLETEGQDALDVSLVAFEAGLSMEWISDLCCTPLFYHRCGAPHRQSSAPQRYWKIIRKTPHGTPCRGP